jgi:leader peptidase (prepilin peptidase)/N-methyltransferase
MDPNLHILTIAAAGIIGLCIGSFLNVVIYRLPREISLFKPSTCPKSGKPIAWHDNIPILSYMLLRGKGRHSKQPIGIQYPLVEAFTGILFALHFALLPIPQAVTASIAASALIPIICIDAKYTDIYTSTCLTPVIALLAIALWQPDWILQGHVTQYAPKIDATILILTNFCMGFGILATIALIADTFLNRTAFGYGDFILAATISAFAGPTGVLNALIFGSLLTLIAAPLLKRIPPPYRLHLPTERRRIAEIATNKNLDDNDCIEALDEKLTEIQDKTHKPKNIPFGPGLTVAFYLQFVCGFNFLNLLQTAGRFLRQLTTT